MYPVIKYDTSNHPKAINYSQIIITWVLACMVMRIGVIKGQRKKERETQR